MKATLKKIWEVRKSQKWPHSLQTDEIKWLADQINHGNATAQEVHARYVIHIENFRELQKMKETVSKKM